MQPEETALASRPPQTLLQIAADVRALADLLDDLDSGELPAGTADPLDQWFAEIAHNRAHKLDGYAALIREFSLRANARADEAKRLNALAQADENRAKRLKERLKLYFLLTETKKVETERFRLALASNGGKVPVAVHVPAEALPAELVRMTIEPNLDAIRTALEAGAIIPGCALQARGHHIRIT